MTVAPVGQIQLLPVFRTQQVNGPAVEAQKPAARHLEDAGLLDVLYAMTNQSSVSYLAANAA